MNIKKMITSAAVISAMAFSAAPVSKNVIPMFHTTSITASAARTVSYTDVDNFFKKYNGKGIDIDYYSGVQCVDLISLYISEVCGISNTTLNGFEYWTLYNSRPFLYNNFTRIANTDDFVPQKGDIMVWNKASNCPYGHVAICTGEGTTTWFNTYEQNTYNHHEPTTKRCRNYDGVAGVLRYKHINGTSSSAPAVTTNATGNAQLGTLWVNNDTYTFTKKKKMYADKDCKKEVGYIQKGQKKKMVSFVRYGQSILGKTSDGYYIAVNTKGVLNANAYVIVDCKALNVRSDHNTSSSIINVVYKNTSLLITKTYDNWGYAPAVGGWISLSYVRG